MKPSYQKREAFQIGLPKGAMTKKSPSSLEVLFQDFCSILQLNTMPEFALVERHIIGSAFALLRAAFEALVRGLWLQLCASDKEIEVFYEKDRLPSGLKFGPMISAIEQHLDFSDKVLSQLKDSSWEAMNSLTHGGMLQLDRRINRDFIEPNFDPGEIVEVLRASGFFALLALRQIARLSKNNAVEAAAEAKLDGTDLSLD